MADRTARDIADHLSKVAQLEDLAGAPRFKIIAFHDAAEKVMSLAAEDLSAASLKKTLGKSSAACAVQFFETGASDRLEGLSKKYPVEMLDLTVVEGIGPKTAFKFWQGGIHSLEELADQARKGELSERMKNAVLFALESKGRIPLSTAEYMAKGVIEYLRDLNPDIVKRIEVCGSVRRKKATIKDLDILLEIPNTSRGDVLGINDMRPYIADYFILYGDEVQRGRVKSKIQIQKHGVAVQCDLWIVNEWQWGSALNYATGNKWHNIMLRQLCAERDWRFNEYGVYEAGNITTEKFLELADNNELDYRDHGALERHGDNSYVASRLGGTNERDVYSLLNIPYVEPEDREMNEEEARNYVRTSKLVNS